MQGEKAIYQQKWS